MIYYYEHQLMTSWYIFKISYVESNQGNRTKKYEIFLLTTIYFRLSTIAIINPAVGVGELSEIMKVYI